MKYQDIITGELRETKKRKSINYQTEHWVTLKDGRKIIIQNKVKERKLK